MPRRWPVVVIGLLLCVALLAACGEADDATSPAGGGGGTAATPTPAPTATPLPQAPSLDGTHWLLAGMGGRDLDMERPITLSFTEGQAGGNAGCNDYGATYSTGDDGTITFHELHNTDMACETGMDLEATYLNALGRATNYQLSEHRLELLDAAGEQLLFFTPDERSELDGTRWLVAYLDGNLLVTDTHIRFEFKDGQVSGSAGCNTFFATYTTGERGELAIGDAARTEMGCPEPKGIMEQEEAFFDALLDVRSYRDLGETHLELLDAEGTARIVIFNRDELLPAASLLTNTAWVLTAQNDQPVDNFTVTLMFDRDAFAGMADCLYYASSVHIEPQGVIIELDDIRTIDQCAPASRPPAADIYLDILATVRAYRYTGEQLVFHSETGETLLTFRPASTDSELQEPHWTLLTLSGTPVIEGSEITLAFNGWANGNSGCNGYGARYMIVEPGVIWIQEVASEAMACEGPPAGLMQQEDAYQKALPDVVAYRVTGDRLELMNAAGEVTLEYQRQ